MVSRGAFSFLAGLGRFIRPYVSDSVPSNHDFLLSFNSERHELAEMLPGLSERFANDDNTSAGEMSCHKRLPCRSASQC
jgi:hypothetical protein